MKQRLFKIIAILIGFGCGGCFAAVTYNSLTAALAPSGVRVECLENCGSVPTWDSCTVWSPPSGATVRYTRTGVYSTVITYNADGYRGAQLPYERTPGTIRVAIYGDSFMQAVEVEDADYIRTQLEARLYGLPYEIIVVGQGGWSPANLYLYWNCQGRNYAPDVVIYHAWSNDIPDSLPSYFQAGNGILATLEWRIAGGVMFPAQVEPVAAGGNPVDVFTASDSPEWVAAWERYEAILTLLRDAVEANGSQFAVAYAPSPTELDGDTYVYERMMAIYERLNIETIDLYTPYSQANVFLEGDGHYSIEGHSVLANVLYEWITR
jgi:hypothetical protein